MTDRRPALGKGLSALIPDVPERQPTGVTEVDIDLVRPHAHQPRKSIDAEGLKELADSIRQNGVIQPILVRRTGSTFQIIAGERRWRAAGLAGLRTVPVVVREVGDEQHVLELALIENIQRENLNAIDEAQAYERLGTEFQLTQEQIAAAVGKDRSTVSNFIRLLRLHENIQTALSQGSLSMGHARALLGLADPGMQMMAFKEVVDKGLSVRATEALVHQLTVAVGPTRARQAATPAVERTNDVDTRAAEEKLKFALGSPVRIVRRAGRGRIEIDFTSEAELIRLFDLLTDRR